MDEEFVYTTSRNLLAERGWQILAGQPPGGSHDIPLVEIRSPMRMGKGSRGSFKPDLICYRNGFWLLVEAKPKYSLSDHRKLLSILDDPLRIKQLAISLNERRLLDNRVLPEATNTRAALAYCGAPREIAPIGCILADTGVVRLYLETDEENYNLTNASA